MNNEQGTQDGQEQEPTPEEQMAEFIGFDNKGEQLKSDPAAETGEEEDLEDDDTEGGSEDDTSDEDEDDADEDDTEGESEDDTSDEDEAGADREEDHDAEEEKPKKRKKTASERIAEITKFRRQAEEERDRQAAEVARLRRENEELQKSRSASGDDEDLTSEKDKDKGKGDEPPDPNDFDYGEVDPRYISALVEYRTNKTISESEKSREEARKAEAAEREASEIQHKYGEVITRGAKKYDDFDDVVVDGANNGRWPLAEHTVRLLLDSEVGEDVAYHLATHPEEAKELAGLDPTKAAVHFGRLEQRFISSNKDAPKKRTRKVSKAPPPPKNRAKGSGGKASTAPDTEDFESFEKAFGNRMR